MLLTLVLAACAPTGPAVRFADPEAAMIIGGSSATIDDHPTLVSLQDAATGQHLCGGTLVDPFWVLTAAHCVDDAALGSLQVEWGATLLGEGDVEPIVAWVEHPDHAPNHAPFDIALLRLGNPITDVVPMPLVTVDGAETWGTAGTLATIAGWGHVDAELDTPAEQLQQAQVPLVDLATCQALYAPDKVVLDTMVCAGDLVDGGVDTCQGDSGGPLLVETDDGWGLLGVVSWGTGCGEPEHPGVYTRVPSYLNWILHEIEGTELDDYGNSLGDAEPATPNFTYGRSGTFLEDDVDTFVVPTSSLRTVTIATASALDITARVLAADGTVLATSDTPGDVSLQLAIDGDAVLELSGPVGSYELLVDIAPAPSSSSSSSGCGSSAWSSLLPGRRP